MDGIPFKRSAQLTAQMNVKLEKDLERDIKIVGALGADVPEMVRLFLRKKIPAIKKKLSQPA